MTKQEDLSLSLSPSSSFAAAFLCFSLSIRPFVVQFSSSSCASFASFLFRLLPFLPVLDKQTGSTSIDGQRGGGNLSPPRSTMTLSRCMIAPLLHGPSISRSRFPPPLSPRGNASLQVVFHEKAGKRERDPKARVSSLEDFELGEGGGDDAASPRFERGGI